MSHQSKNAGKLRVARSLKGKKGPARTATKHGKKNAWWQKSRTAPHAVNA